MLLLPLSYVYIQVTCVHVIVSACVTGKIAREVYISLSMEVLNIQIMSSFVSLVLLGIMEK